MLRSVVVVVVAVVIVAQLAEMRGLFRRHRGRRRRRL